jgi:catechol 2,3-dioxygenase-like lactoylglutathione lyase family enzyme
MTSNIFADASTVSTVIRVRDVTASVAWYREKLGLEPIHVGADGPDGNCPRIMHAYEPTTIATATWSWSRMATSRMRGKR